MASEIKEAFERQDREDIRLSAMAFQEQQDHYLFSAIVLLDRLEKSKDMAEMRRIARVVSSLVSHSQDCREQAYEQLSRL